MSVYKRKGSAVFWYKFVFDGGTVQKSSGTREREAAEQAEARHKNELWEHRRLGIKPSKEWSHAVVSYIATLTEGRNKEQTKAELLWASEHLPLTRRLSTIDLDALQLLQLAKAAAITKRTGKPAAPGTVNRALGIVMSVLHHACSAKWIDHVPKLAKIPDRKRVIRFIPREQAVTLLGELPPHQRAMVIFALETGLRRSNVTQLRWEQVDIKRRITWVNPDEAKEGEGIPVPLSETAATLLSDLQGNDAEFVFVYRGKPVKQTSTKAWKAAKARAGIKNFRWHDLRHTWASWHRQDGTPTTALKELGGWKDDRMPGRYAHLGAEHLAEYVQRRVGLGTDLGTVRKQQKEKKL
jgi:integrase